MNRRLFWALSAVGLLFMSVGNFADAEDLKTGDPIPDFEMVGSDGKTYSKKSLKGKAFVISWYPKAFTGG